MSQDPDETGVFVLSVNIYRPRLEEGKFCLTEGHQLTDLTCFVIPSIEPKFSVDNTHSQS